MVERIARAFALSMFREGVIQEKEVAIMQYRLFHILSSAVHIVLLVLVSLPFGTGLHTFVFTVCFSTIKRYAGGYHANKHWHCLVQFTALAFGAVQMGIFAYEFISQFWLPAVPSVTAAALVWVIGPRPHYNRPVSGAELTRFRQISRCTSSAQVVILTDGSLLLREWGAILMCGAVGGLMAVLSLMIRKEGDENA